MKMLFQTANNIALANTHRQSTSSNQLNEIVDTKSCFVIDKLVISNKDK